MYKVSKRDGTIVDFDLSRISAAITKAFVACNKISDEGVIDFIALKVTSDFQSKIKDGVIAVEDIQDSVEFVLGQSGYSDVAKAYILYRKQRDKLRNVQNTLLDYKDLVNKYVHNTDWRVKENSTVTYSVGGLILSNSGAISANYWLSEIYDEEIAKAHKNADMHIHDLSMITGYCAGWSLKQLIEEGLGGVPGKITSAPAKHLHTLCNQMVNFLGIMQNEWAGAQAFSSFDTYLAPFVKADNLTYKEVKQCIQSFVYGVNTPSRWGCVDEDTEVLSVDGFKKHNELKEGDLIYTWNAGRLELNPVRKVIVKPFDGVLHEYKGRGYNQTITPNHRMLVQKRKSNESVIALSQDVFDAKAPCRLPTQFDCGIEKEADISDAWIKLAAIIYADGSLDFRNNSLHRIVVFKSVKRYGGELILDLAKECGLDLKVLEQNGKYMNRKYIFYSDSAKRILQMVPNRKSVDQRFLNMNARQSKLFLDTWMRFDGDVRKNKIQCDNQGIVDAIQHIALRAGYTTYVMHRDKTTYVKIRQSKSIHPNQRNKVDYKGLVWCPNVENGTAVFRKDGSTYISGQTQAPFSNITLDWTVPADLADEFAIVGGKRMDFTYGDCKQEMDMINKAFIEVMIEGDANGRGFQYPIPTYSITEDFDWSDTENNRLLFTMTAKYGTPYFSNYINSDMNPSDVRSMCCRLRLDLRELRKKSGGYFGSGESTGSIGVVTINMPRIAYLAESEEDFFIRLDKVMDVAARSLDIKRTVINKFLNEGLYPYTKRYLEGLDNHFSTIGLVGMNEAGLNAKWLKKDMTHLETQEFSKKVLLHMRERLSDYQEKYGNLYNLEATPAESTSYRLAKHDRERYPDIVCASEGETPYYTNSTNLPVGYTDDLFAALDIQDELQTLYTSGTVFHTFLGEKLPDWKSAASLVRTIAKNYKLPYYSISPTYSVCKGHGYLAGEQFECPHCGEKTEVYSRITGYYRPVNNWNVGKAQEYKERKVYDLQASVLTHDGPIEKLYCECCDGDSAVKVEIPDGTYLVATATCPKCRVAEMLLSKKGISYVKLLVEENEKLVSELEIKQAPTLVVVQGSSIEKISSIDDIKKYLG